MIYLIKNGNSPSNIAIIYDKKYIPSDVPFLELPFLPTKENCQLCLTSDASGYYWEEKEQLNSVIDLTPLKEEKIQESKIKLQEYLVNNPIYSNAHNNIYAYYTVTSEKQSLLTSAFLGYQILKTLGQEAVFTWNAEGQVCEPWTEAEGMQLMGEIRNYVKPLVEYQQRTELAIRAATSEEEILNIKINYSDVYKNKEEV